MAGMVYGLGTTINTSLHNHTNYFRLSIEYRRPDHRTPDWPAAYNSANTLRVLHNPNLNVFEQREETYTSRDLNLSFKNTHANVSLDGFQWWQIFTTEVSTHSCSISISLTTGIHCDWGELKLTTAVPTANFSQSPFRPAVVQSGDIGKMDFKWSNTWKPPIWND